MSVCIVVNSKKIFFYRIGRKKNPQSRLPIPQSRFADDTKLKQFRVIIIIMIIINFRIHCIQKLISLYCIDK